MEWEYWIHLFPVQYLDTCFRQAGTGDYKGHVGFWEVKVYSLPCLPAKIDLQLSKTGRTGLCLPAKTDLQLWVKLEEQDFAQHRWMVLILESSHCLGFLPFISCYISSKTISTKIAMKTCESILKHTHIPVWTDSAASSCFHPLPSSCSKAHGGDCLRVFDRGEDSRALVLPSASLWCDLVFMPAVYTVSMSFSFPLALSACFVCFAMAVSM